METRIRDFVTLHELGGQIQIIELDCVQLSCRIFGRSSDQSVWQKVYVEMFFSFVKEGYAPNKANTKKGVTFADSESGAAYFYNQMAFLK